MSTGFIDDKSTLVQVMAWCRQATSHYLSHCWFRPIMPYGITWPQWVIHKWCFNGLDQHCFMNGLLSDSIKLLPDQMQIYQQNPMEHISMDFALEIIWSNADLFLIRSQGTTFSEISIKIRKFSWKKMHLKMLSAKWGLFCVGLNV